MFFKQSADLYCVAFLETNYPLNKKAFFRASRASANYISFGAIVLRLIAPPARGALQFRQNPLENYYFPEPAAALPQTVSIL